MGAEPSTKDAELSRLCGILERVGEQHRYRLTLKQLTVLLTSYLNDQDRTLRTIAFRLRSAKPAVSRMVEHLIEQGLIERVPDPRDRRSVLFQCTPAGQKFLRGVVTKCDQEP